MPTVLAIEVDDVVNALTSTATTKPLSANQGKVLKDYVDALEVIVAKTGVPTSQGSYVLTVSVDSNGNPTFSWVGA